MRGISQVGDRSSSDVGQVQLAAASPGTGWIAFDSITEYQIAQLRRNGGLSRVPKLVRSVASPLIVPNNWTYSGIDVTTFAYSITSPEMYASGSSLVYTASRSGPSSNQVLGAVPIFGRSLGSTGLTGNVVNGVSFAKSEFHFISSSGLYSGMPVAGLTVRGTTDIAGSSAYNQVRYIGSNYVAFATGGGQPLKYSSDRVTWTSATVPSLNGDGGGAGNSVIWIELDATHSRLIAITAYGEILTSTDGQTWTKSYTRAAGGTSQVLSQFCVMDNGKLAACGSASVAGTAGLFVAANEATAFTTTTLSVASKTFTGAAISVTFTSGVLAAMFSCNNSTTGVEVAVSVDRGLTWSFATGGDGTMNSDNGGQVRVTKTAGQIILHNGFTPAYFNPTAQVLVTDFGLIAGRASVSGLIDMSGTVIKPYIRVY